MPLGIRLNDRNATLKQESGFPETLSLVPKSYMDIGGATKI